MRSLYFIIPAALGILICACSPAPVADGGTDVGNGRVAGIVVDSAGNPVSGAEVRLMSAKHDPYGDARNTMTTVRICRSSFDGRYLFSEVDTGYYSIDSRDLRHDHAEAAELRWGIRVGNTDTTFANGDTVEAPAKGYVELPRSGIVPGAYVYIPGSCILGIVDSAAIAARRLDLPGIPFGKLPSVYFRPAPDSPWLIRLEAEIELEHGDSVELELPDHPLASDSLLYATEHD